MSGARDQVTRLLALAPYLQTRGEVRLKDAAADFGVTPAQLLKDLRVLYMCGLPGFGPGDLIDINVEALLDDPDGVISIGNAEYLARPLRLGSTEASALLVGLRALLESSPEGTRDVIERTLAKLERAAESGSGPVVAVHQPEPRVDLTPALRELDRAVGTNRQVQLGYYVPARDETTDRVVDPIALLRVEGRDYLDAWCHLAEDRRLFRVDRITAVAVLESARLTHDLEPRDLSAGLFAPGPDDAEARVRLTPNARWFAEYYPVLSTEECADGALEVTLAVADERWLLRLALRFGPDLTVLAPEGLRHRIRSVAREALGLHGGTA